MHFRATKRRKRSWACSLPALRLLRGFRGSQTDAHKCAEMRRNARFCTRAYGYAKRSQNGPDSQRGEHRMRAGCLRHCAQARRLCHVHAPAPRSTLTRSSRRGSGEGQTEAKESRAALCSALRRNAALCSARRANVQNEANQPRLSSS